MQKKYIFSKKSDQEMDVVILFDASSHEIVLKLIWMNIQYPYSLDIKLQTSKLLTQKKDLLKLNSIEKQERE